MAIRWRFGSDEFVILLPGIKQDDDALNLAERVLARVERAYRVGEHELYLGASVERGFLPTTSTVPWADSTGRHGDVSRQAEGPQRLAMLHGRSTVVKRMALRNELQEAIECGNFEALSIYVDRCAMTAW
ncbi:diguanylate cyclase [Billgrantia gudaonensis]|uniref:Diguanylate cyclase n=1 Tax=Billgrantia gudaonensis TaxID=376427 RepID=A0A432JJL3_9GAMM|nr:diguanylate cyclase [Halomonas gudaonensis]